MKGHQHEAALATIRDGWTSTLHTEPDLIIILLQNVLLILHSSRNFSYTTGLHLSKRIRQYKL